MLLEIMAIPLSRGLYALVDGKDYKWLSRWVWTALRAKYTYYAVRTTWPERKMIYMHRIIVKTPNGMVTDHINENGLDNRRANLRVCSKTKNTQKVRKKKRGGKATSLYRGVYFTKNNNWHARIRFRNKKINLGVFPNEIEAAKAYDRKALELFGKLAAVNFEGSKYQKHLREIGKE